MKEILDLNDFLNAIRWKESTQNHSHGMLVYEFTGENGKPLIHVVCSLNESFLQIDWKDETTHTQVFAEWDRQKNRLTENTDPILLGRGRAAQFLVQLQMITHTKDVSFFPGMTQKLPKNYTPV